MKLIFFYITLFLISHFSFSKDNDFVFFKGADKFFNKYVKEGQVDYMLVMREKKDLDYLIKIIGTTDLSSVQPEYKKAFYINAYNILLVKNVVANFPVIYPLEATGFFSQVKHYIAGDSLTLNEIEKKLTVEFKDVRILFALSSASKGSVPMADFAFKPSKLDKQFEKIIKPIVNSYDFIRVMSKSEKIYMAENFKKSQKDFKKEDIIYYINKYREEPLPVTYTIDYYPANRKLNIQYGAL